MIEAAPSDATPPDGGTNIVPMRQIMSDSTEPPLHRGDQIAQALPAPKSAQEILERQKPSVPRDVVEEQYRRLLTPRTESTLQEPPPGSREYENAMRDLRRLEASQKGTTVEPTPDTPEYQAADLDARRLELEEQKGGVEPSPGTAVRREADEEANRMQRDDWQGVKVRLPNGDFIEDPKSPTGYVMAPVNNLKSVAADARRAREKLPPFGPTTAIEYLTALRSVLRENLAQGGKYDDQRRRDPSAKDGVVQLRQFRSIANINVGLFCQQVGLSHFATITLATLYALGNSSNSSASKPLDDDTRKYIEIGYELGQSGQFDENRR